MMNLNEKSSCHLYWQGCAAVTFIDVTRHFFRNILWSHLWQKTKLFPFSRHSFVVLLNNSFIAAYFVTLHAHYFSTLSVNVFIKIINSSKRFVACFTFCCIVNSNILRNVQNLVSILAFNPSFH